MIWIWVLEAKWDTPSQNKPPTLRPKSSQLRELREIKGALEGNRHSRCAWTHGAEMFETCPATGALHCHGALLQM